MHRKNVLMHEGSEGPTTDLSRVTAMDLNLLVPLLAVLEERSVTRAAARVGLSQPAMSHALRRIRRLLGDEVLVRRGNAFTLTPRAVALIGPLRRILQQTAALVSQASFDPATTTRTVTLAMTTSTAYVAGPAFTRTIAERAPHATVRILTTTDTGDTVFTGERADVLLLSEGVPTPHQRSRLYHDRWVVVTGELLASGETVEAALRERPHVVYDSARPLRPYQILHERGIPFTVRERVNDQLLIPSLVAGTPRIAFQRHSVASTMQQRSLPLHLAEFPFPITGLGIDLVWNPWLGDPTYRTWLDGTLRDASAPHVFTSRM